MKLEGRKLNHPPKFGGVTVLATLVLGLVALVALCGCQSTPDVTPDTLYLVQKAARAGAYFVASNNLEEAAIAYAAIPTLLALLEGDEMYYADILDVFDFVDDAFGEIDDETAFIVMEAVDTLFYYLGFKTPDPEGLVSAENIAILKAFLTGVQQGIESALRGRMTDGDQRA